MRSWVLAALCGRASLAPSVSTTYEIPSDLTQFRGRVTVKCGKCRESDGIVNRLFSRTFPSAARTKSSLTTDGRPLRCSSRTFSRPSLKFLIHIIESLMAFSQYTSQSWRWMSAGCTFLAFRKRITDCISQAAGSSIVLNILNTQNDASPRSDCLKIVSVACQWIKELSTHAHNRDRSAAAEISANGTYFLDTPRNLLIIGLLLRSSGPW
jgi:hypothetical protein